MAPSGVREELPEYRELPPGSQAFGEQSIRTGRDLPPEKLGSSKLEQTAIMHYFSCTRLGGHLI